MLSKTELIPSTYSLCAFLLLPLHSEPISLESYLERLKRWKISLYKDGDASFKLAKRSIFLESPAMQIWSVHVLSAENVFNLLIVSLEYVFYLTLFIAS